MKLQINPRCRYTAPDYYPIGGPYLMDKYFWLIIAAVCGGYVAQVKKAENLPLWKRASHLAAGAACAVYFSPFGIRYFELIDSDGQYLVPFVIGAFWWKFFEALEVAAGGLKLPWGT